MYFGRKYTSKINGFIWVPVRCDNCSLGFAYKYNIRAQGKGESAYLLNNSGAQERAEQRANKDFERKAQNTFAMVPCPKCGTVHSSMIKHMQRKNSNYAIGLALASGAVLSALLGGEAIVRLMMLVWFGSIIVWLFTRNTIVGIMATFTGVLGMGILTLHEYAPQLTKYNIFFALLPLLIASFFIYRGFLIDYNADKDKNKQKARKYELRQLKSKTS